MNPTLLGVFPASKLEYDFYFYELNYSTLGGTSTLIYKPMKPTKKIAYSNWKGSKCV